MKNSNNSAGKGDSPRLVNKKVYTSNFDDINWGNKSKKKSKLKTIDDVCNQKIPRNGSTLLEQSKTS